MRRCLAALVLILLPTLAPADNVPMPRSRPLDPATRVAGSFQQIGIGLSHLDDRQLLAKYATLNGECRGRSGDYPTTLRICEERERYGTELERRGWCFGPAQLPMYRQQWLRCDDPKIIADEIAKTAEQKVLQRGLAKPPQQELHAHRLGEMLRMSHYNCPHVIAYGQEHPDHYGTLTRVLCSNDLAYDLYIRPDRQGFFALPQTRYSADVLIRTSVWRHASVGPTWSEREEAKEAAEKRRCEEEPARKLGGIAATLLLPMGGGHPCRVRMP